MHIRLSFQGMGENNALFSGVEVKRNVTDFLFIITANATVLPFPVHEIVSFCLHAETKT